MMIGTPTGGRSTFPTGIDRAGATFCVGCLEKKSIAGFFSAAFFFAASATDFLLSAAFFFASAAAAFF